MDFIPGRAIFEQRSEFNQPRHFILALLTILVVAALAIWFFRLVDGLLWASTLVTQALVMWAGLAILSPVILRRDDFKARWGKRGYAMAFRWLGIPGLTLVGVGAAHFAFIEGARIVPREAQAILCTYLFASGFLLWLRAIITFGIDNLTLVYVYYPAESRLVESKVYSVVRHPIYSAALRVIFALIVLNGSPFALFAGVMAPLSMWVWVHFVEERELIERFGDGYRDYRRRVPAFFNFDPRTWATLWRFLIGGK
jgi:protein-S-isoprenylcysteine O-methyltransferase Ste14